MLETSPGSPSGSAFRVAARAPSNIAIVKYMGKADAARNLPANASLSMTLSKLCTVVELASDPDAADSHILAGAKPAGAAGEAPVLDAAGAGKFLRHLARVRERAPAILGAAGLGFRARGPVAIRTANTFPQAAGIASSASSFAALTLAGLAYFAERPRDLSARSKTDADLRRAAAALAREGSGSSCRSIDGPFVAWEGADAATVSASLPPLSDLVVVVSAGRKEVGSSEAHRRVTSSPFWAGRAERAGARFVELRRALESGDFGAFARIAAEDAEDMHRLFETSAPPFAYRTAATHEVVDFLPQVGASYAWTLDAGPNVHVVVPQSEEEFWRRRLVARFPQHPLLVDRQGAGAEILATEGAG